jgi:cytochrome b561
MCLHWLIAFAIIAMLAIGWIMSDLPNSDPSKFGLFQWHKSIGITILALSIFRLVWRLMNPAPALPNNLKLWEKWAAKSTHWLFYALIIIMPLTGWIIVSTSKYNIPTMLYGLIPLPHIPGLEGLENKADIHGVSENMHGFLAYMIASLLVLHVGAALKHHVMNRDDVLLRMSPNWLGGILKRFGGPKILGFLALGVGLSFSPAAHAKEWMIDYAQSQIGFSGKQSGEAFKGGFKSFQSTVDFDAVHPETAKISATIDIASAYAGSAERDSYLPQTDWFNVKTFPKAEFVSTTIKAKPDLKDCFEASGNLTIKGASKQVLMPFCMKTEGDHWRVDGHVMLQRTDYAIGTGQWSGDDLVQHAVDVTISLSAKQK